MTERLPVGQEVVVLELLIGRRDKEMYGLEMIAAAPKQLGRNSIYVVLTRMVARGLLASRLETDEEQKTRGPKRRLYKITAFGQQMYNARVASDRAAQRAITVGGVPKPAGTL